MLCYATLYYTKQCYATLYTMLSYAMLHYTIRSYGYAIPACGASTLYAKSERINNPRQVYWFGGSIVRQDQRPLGVQRSGEAAVYRSFVHWASRYQGHRTVGTGQGRIVAKLGIRSLFCIRRCIGDKDRIGVNYFML